MPVHADAILHVKSCRVLILLLTFVEAVVVHVSVHVQILSGHEGEFCLGVLIWSIIRVVTGRENVRY